MAVDGLTDREERLAEAVAGMLLRPLGPQHAGQFRPGDRLSVREREDRDQRLMFARGDRNARLRARATGIDQAGAA